MAEFDNKIEKWYESRMVFMLTLLSPVVVAVLYFAGMKTDIALIQADIRNINTNHEAHIQDLTQEIKDLNKTTVEEETQIIELQKQIISLIDHQH